MSDLDTQIRQTLERHAAGVRPDAGAWSTIAERIERGSPIELRDSGARPRRTPLLLAAAAVLIVAMVGAFLVTRDDDASIDLGPAAPDEVEGGVPSWFDPASAAPVFQSGQAEPDAAVARYVGDRFGEAGPVLTIPPVVRNGSLASATWRTNEDGGALIASGTILLREDLQENEWEVVASFIDQVSIDRATHDGVRIDVVGANASGQSAWLALGTNTGSPLEDRFARTFEVGAESVTVRIDLVGGTTLGVAELRLDPPKGYPIWPALGFEALADRQLDADQRRLPVRDVPETAAAFATEALGYSVATLAGQETYADFASVTLDVDDGQQLTVDLGRQNRDGALWYVIGAATPGFGTFVEDGGNAVTPPVAGTIGFRVSNEIARSGSLPHDRPASAGDGHFFVIDAPGILQVELAGDDGRLYVALTMVRP